MALDHTLSSPQKADQHRAPRIVATCAFVPAVALLLPCGIISALPLPVVGIAPMFFSSAFSFLKINGTPLSPKTTFFIDLLIAMFLISVLLPRFVGLSLQFSLISLSSWIAKKYFFSSWISMSEGRLTDLERDGLLMLGTYGTMPMMVNL